MFCRTPSRALDLISSAGVPVIYFSTGTGGFLEVVAEAGGSAIGVDWRIPLDVAWARSRARAEYQGNLDPLTLFAPLEIVEREAAAVLQRAAGRPGHVFNLGHGVHPQTSGRGAPTPGRVRSRVPRPSRVLSLPLQDPLLVDTAGE